MPPLPSDLDYHTCLASHCHADNAARIENVISLIQQLRLNAYFSFLLSNLSPDLICPCNFRSSHTRRTYYVITRIRWVKNLELTVRYFFAFVGLSREFIKEASRYSMRTRRVASQSGLTLISEKLDYLREEERYNLSLPVHPLISRFRSGDYVKRNLKD